MPNESRITLTVISLFHFGQCRFQRTSNKCLFSFLCPTLGRHATCIAAWAQNIFKNSWQSMIYVVNSPKLAYLWSLMSEVKCVMWKPTLTHKHTHLCRKSKNAKWTQTFHTTSTVHVMLHGREKKSDTTFEQDVLIFRSIVLFTL